MNNIDVIIKPRYQEIDIYRGWAILLIMLGHSFCEFPVNLKAEFMPFPHYLVVFNLNMFFLISGVLFSVKGSWKDFFSKKFKRLMLPWLFFVVLSITMRSIAGSFTHSQIGSIPKELFLALTTAKYYWFLYVLFIMMLMARLLHNKYAIAVVGGAFLIMSTIGIKSTWNALLLNRIIVYFPYFVVGMLIKERYAEIRKYVEKRLWLFTIMSVLILLFIVYCMYTGLFERIHFVVPFSICSTLWVLSVSFSSIVKNEKVFSYFGFYSLQYYLNHLLIMLLCFYAGAFFFNRSSLLSLIVVYMLALILSTIMLQVEKRLSWLRFLCGFN